MSRARHYRSTDGPDRVTFLCKACGWESGWVRLIPKHKPAAGWPSHWMRISDVGKGIQCHWCPKPEPKPEVESWMSNDAGIGRTWIKRPRGFWASSPSEAVFFDDLYGRRIAPKPRCP